MEAILYFGASAKYSAAEKIAGVRDVASAAGLHVQVVADAPDPGRMSELVSFWQPVGAVVDLGPVFSIDTLPLCGVTTVFLSGDASLLPRGAFHIRHDSAATARLAARELLETGFEHFAFVPSREPRHWSDERALAFKQAVGINGRQCLMMERSGACSSETDWQRALRKFVGGLPRPCGLFAANDATAADVLVAARFEGVSVPDDLAVVGVDNFPEICENTLPTLTSVEPDFRSGGRMAARLLLDVVRAHGRFHFSRTMSFGPLRVVRRSSCGRAQCSDKFVAAALELIRREACSGLRAETVARLFPCSRRMADERFRRATGHSFLEEIHCVRLDHAKWLLARSDMPLKTVSDFCGFENPNSLRKFFRRAVGSNMSDWRRENSQKD